MGFKIYAYRQELTPAYEARVREHIDANILDPRNLDCATVFNDHIELAFKSGIERRLPLPA